MFESNMNAIESTRQFGIFTSIETHVMCCECRPKGIIIKQNRTMKWMKKMHFCYYWWRDRLIKCLTLQKLIFDANDVLLLFLTFFLVIILCSAFFSCDCVYFLNIIIFRLCFHYNRHCRVSHLFLLFGVWSLSLRSTACCAMNIFRVKIWICFLFLLLRLFFPFCMLFFVLCKHFVFVCNRNHCVLLWFFPFSLLVVAVMF